MIHNLIKFCPVLSIGSEISPRPDPKLSAGKAVLDRARAPNFVAVPEDQTVTEGTPVCLTVEVDAEPRPQVMWMKNREPIDPREAKMHQDGNKYSLIFDSTKPKDSGFYTCVASNPAGKTERATRLSVKRKCIVVLSIYKSRFILFVFIVVFHFKIIIFPKCHTIFHFNLFCTFADIK